MENGSVFYGTLLLLFLGFPAEEGFTVSDRTEELEDVGRILGGDKAPYGAYPWMVSVHEKYPKKDKYEHLCGGVIVNENWIVTAAHCLRLLDEKWRLEVIVGMYNLATKSSPYIQQLKVSKLIPHENYCNETMQDDIALIKTAKAMNFTGTNGFVGPINLPVPGSEPVGNATVIGWGHTVENGTVSDELLQVTVPIVPRDICAWKDFLNESWVSEKQICAGMSGMDACQYDSGGPLFQTNDGVSTLIGTVSFGMGCGNAIFPGVYTKVSSYIDWLQNTMKNE